jgi:hypothetical protein
MQSTDIFAVKANIGVAAMFDINTMAAFLGGCTALDFAVLICSTFILVVFNSQVKALHDKY